MAQGQWYLGNKQLVRGTPAADNLKGTLATLVDVVGIVTNDGTLGGEAIITTLGGPEYTESVFAAEVIAAGQALYYHAQSDVLTGMVTDWPFGWAERAKGETDTGLTVVATRPVRQRGKLTVPLNFAEGFAADLGDIGTANLITFASEKLITSARLIHDGNLAGATATVALDGDSADTIYAAAAVSTFDASGEEVSTLPPVAASKIDLTIAVAALTAGILVVEIEYSDIA